MEHGKEIWNVAHHDIPERHEFGRAFHVPRFPIFNPGISQTPAREDHEHGSSDVNRVYEYKFGQVYDGDCPYFIGSLLFLGPENSLSYPECRIVNSSTWIQHFQIIHNNSVAHFWYDLQLAGAPSWTTSPAAQPDQNVYFIVYSFWKRSFDAPHFTQSLDNYRSPDDPTHTTRIPFDHPLFGSHIGDPPWFCPAPLVDGFSIWAIPIGAMRVDGVTYPVHAFFEVDTLLMQFQFRLRYLDNATEKPINYAFLAAHTNLELSLHFSWPMMGYTDWWGLHDYPG